jgi:hypothetical protein
MMMKNIVDNHLQKFISRKLLVWVTASGFLLADKLNGEQWMAIALAYVGVQGFADIAIRWKEGRLKGDSA